MDGVTLLSEARAAGLSVEAAGDRLVIRGPRSAEPVARLLLERKPEIFAALRKPLALSLYVRLLDAEIWLVATDADATALEVELARGGDPRSVLTALELCHLADMVRDDATDAARALLGIKRVFPGARIRPFGPEALDV